MYSPPPELTPLETARPEAVSMNMPAPPAVRRSMSRRVKRTRSSLSIFPPPKNERRSIRRRERDVHRTGTRQRTAADAARVGTRASPVRRAPLASSSAAAQRKPHRSDLPQSPTRAPAGSTRVLHYFSRRNVHIQPRGHLAD